MKQSFAILFLVLFTASLTMANFTDVPTKVIEAFEAEFSDAEAASWDMKGDLYVADFEMEGQRMNASYEASGEWVETITFLSEEDLPDTISQYLTEEYEVADIVSAQLIETPQNTTYEVSIEVTEEVEETEEREEGTEELTQEEGNLQVLRLSFDTKGNLLK